MLKVLISVDGSPSSKYSIEQVMTTSILKDAEVHLVTVISPSRWSPTRNPGLNKELKTEKAAQGKAVVEEAYDIPTLNPSLNEELFNALGDADNQYSQMVLEDAKKTMSSVVTPIAAVIRKGDAAEEILKYAEEIGSDMIVMGNRGLGTFSKALMGSVSQKVLTHSCCSVMIIKQPST